MAKAERWRKIPSQPKYEASNLGRVRFIGHEPRKLYVHMGYPTVTIFTVGVGTKSYFVHRLVADAFLGPCPPKQEVNHINGNRSDNHPANLEYLTRSAHAHHAITIGQRGVGENHPCAKLSDVEVCEIKKLLSAGLLHRTIATRFNVTRSHISLICSGRRRR